MQLQAMVSDGNVGNMLFTAAIAISTFILLLYWVGFRWRNRVSKKNLAPGPKPIPILGVMHLLGRRTKIWDALDDLHAIYGDIMHLQIGSRQCVIVGNAQGTREVLVNRASFFHHRPPFNRFDAVFRGNRHYSVALSDWSERHRRRREMLYPRMHPRLGTAGYTVMAKAVDAALVSMIDRIAKLNGAPHNPHWELILTCGNVFLEFFFQARFKHDDKDYVQMLYLYDKVFQQLFTGFAVDFLPWLRHFQRGRFQAIVKLQKTIESFLTKLVRKEEQLLEENKESNSFFGSLLREVEKQPKGDSANLSMIDFEVIVDDLVGGHPVIANMWLWAVYYLACEPEVQRKLRAEVRKKVGVSLLPKVLEHKSKLVYGEAVMFEVLRITSSPIIPHVAAMDTTLLGFDVPKGTVLLFNNQRVNFDPELWKDPLKFIPERFLNETGTSVVKPDYFLPFGTGKRSCMGDCLVRHILHLGLASLVQRFHITLAPGEPPVDYFKAKGQVIFEKPIQLQYHLID